MVFTMVPPILALLTPPTWKSKFINFLYHLPGIQVCKCFTYQTEISKEARQMAKWERRSLLKIQDIQEHERKLERIVDKEERSKCLQEIKAMKVDNRSFLTSKEISEVRKRDAEAAVKYEPFDKILFFPYKIVSCYEFCAFHIIRSNIYKNTKSVDPESKTNRA